MLKKRNTIIWLVVGMMSLALFGIVAIQVYWVRTALRAEQGLIRTSIQSALQTVVAKLESAEARRTMERFLDEEAASIDLELWAQVTQEAMRTDGPLANGESYRDRYLKVETNIAKRYEERWTAQHPGEQMQSMFLPVPTDEQLAVFMMATDDELAGARYIYFGNRQYDMDTYGLVGGHFTQDENMRIYEPQRVNMRQANIQEQDKQLKKLNIKLEQLRLAMNDYLNNPPEVEARLDMGMVRKYLEAELLCRGLPNEFLIGVRTQRGKHLIPAGGAATSQIFRENPSVYKAQLFPNDLRPQHNYLFVAFPNQRNYLLRKLTGIIGSSGIFIGLIIFAFTYTVKTIFRQKRLSQMKTDFINNMTHELKTPIATISLASQALQEPRVQENGEKRTRFVRVIEEENKRLERQVERVLQMAEFDKGELELNLEAVDAAELMLAISEQLRLQVESRGGSLTVNVSADDAVVEADALHLGNTFMNLLDNANKYSPEAPKIEVSITNEPGKVRVAVQDNGIGMSSENLKWIFEKFYRVSTGDRHDVKGFGLGLSYVKNIVDAHHGRIDVKSELGKGSRFEIVLPLLNTYQAKQP